MKELMSYDEFLVEGFLSSFVDKFRKGKKEDSVEKAIAPLEEVPEEPVKKVKKVVKKRKPKKKVTVKEFNDTVEKATEMIASGGAKKLVKLAPKVEKKAGDEGRALMAKLEAVKNGKHKIKLISGNVVMGLAKDKKYGEYYGDYVEDNYDYDEILGENLSLNEGIFRNVLVKMFGFLGDFLIKFAHKLGIWGEILTTVAPYITANFKLFINNPDVHAFLDQVYIGVSDSHIFYVASVLLTYVAVVVYGMVEQYEEELASF